MNPMNPMFPADGITIERAKIHLEAWLSAELSVSTGQSYSINGRSLTRANLSEIRKQIAFWRAEVNKLTYPARRTKRVILRDL